MATVLIILVWLFISEQYKKLKIKKSRGGNCLLLPQCSYAYASKLKSWLRPCKQALLVVSVCSVMSRGVFSFFASQTAATISTIRSFSSTFQMPFVLANTAFNYSARQQLQQQQQQQQQQPQRSDLSYELYITPHYARALVDVIAHYNWKDFWYLYKNDEGE